MHSTSTTPLRLPEPPPGEQAALDDGGVAVWEQDLTIATYEPAPPEKLPMFFDRRVYQGSSGRVYPLPFTERIASEPRDRAWRAVHIENRWIRLVMLPELGGRIHIGYDKTAGYDFFYRNNVIKPALVGLAGPWVSGGVEFNWPQHHRPATFLPMESWIEREPDGAVTVWMSDHDPFARMRGTHGVRLRPDSSLIELRARLHNRTDVPQTFLWWANVAARAHEDYQSFFPTDVRYVADHARRAVTAFPRADRPYYGVDYPARVDAEHPDADRIDYYGNIPVPTSYMVVETRDDFFGGYDHAAGAGFVHWADRRIAPGKKQWTWGNAPFGHAWDDQLTDGDGAYVELMAGVYTDNQPDFSYLAPGEVKTFSQFWYPITGIGAAHQATKDAAVSVQVGDGRVEVGVVSTAVVRDARIRVAVGDRVVERVVDIEPGRPFVESLTGDDVASGDDLRGGDLRAVDVEVTVTSGDRELVRWRPRADDDAAPEPAVATEPPLPADIASADELYLTGVHLAQYRHPTRQPEPYWLEAVKRDAGDARSNTALGAAATARGEYDRARAYLHTAIERLTFRNPNPADGEAHYRLGLVELRRGDAEAAYDAFAKAAWDVRWAHPASVQMGLADARAGRDLDALGRADDARRFGADDPLPRQLRIILLRRLGRTADADAELAALREDDPLDVLTGYLADRRLPADGLMLLDLAGDLERAGERDAALAVLAAATTAPAAGTGAAAPVAEYRRAAVLADAGDDEQASAARRRAQQAPADWAFPAGLDAHDALRRAVAADPADARARSLLGMWLYDRGRRADALDLWREALTETTDDAVLLRNAALATVEVAGDLDSAAALYDRAVRSSADPRLWFELDQLAQRRGIPAAARLARLEPHRELITVRDDLLVTLADLLTATGRAAEAIDLLLSRPLQPWEGGEGIAIRAFARACLARADELRPDAAGAVIERALDAPRSLGEAWHLLDDRASLWLRLGRARSEAGDAAGADTAWRRAVDESVAGEVGADTLDGARAARARGDHGTAASLRSRVAARSTELRTTPARIDYFATSLPETLLFSLDPADDARRRADELEAALARYDAADGSGEPTERSGTPAAATADADREVLA
ncbi:DUF5107 domain-containing protein [Microbacterium sp. cf332]|uniref:DUF5107 domain-containing protein n=1 Tax=Microbacterium sp. cf332 TaxID=1761804 RepID=UPI000887CBB4|nr:DUF5107 domain-containing protein [Microbacterium sp. cf332]SDQ89368.1 Tetratricopeptide repeat [Microbacterium sp. cf332]